MAAAYFFVRLRNGPISLAVLPISFTDHRNQDLIEHSVLDLVSQRILAIALGYEDLNDHDVLSSDQLLAVMVGKADPTGQDRLLPRDKGHALPGKSTLNRLELTPENAGPKNRYKKIVMNIEAIDALLVDTFIESYPEPPVKIIPFSNKRLRFAWRDRPKTKGMRTYYWL